MIFGPHAVPKIEFLRIFDLNNVILLSFSSSFPPLFPLGGGAAAPRGAGGPLGFYYPAYGRSTQALLGLRTPCVYTHFGEHYTSVFKYTHRSEIVHIGQKMYTSI